MNDIAVRELQGVKRTRGGFIRLGGSGFIIGFVFFFLFGFIFEFILGVLASLLGKAAWKVKLAQCSCPETRNK